MESLKSINVKHLKFAIFLGLIGLLFNLFPIPLFANVDLIFGNAAFVITTIILGPWYALICATIAATGLLIHWGTPHVFFLFPLEALFLGFAYRRQIYTLYASCIYWLVIGMPLFYVYAHFFTDLPVDNIPFITIKQGINGILYCTIASLIFLLVPRLKKLKKRTELPFRRTFHHQLQYIFTLIITLTLLVSALLFNTLFVNKQQLLIQKNLIDSATYMGHSTEQYVSSNQAVINNAAQWLTISGTDHTKQQALLSSLHNANASFITMLIADKDGNIVDASPASRMREINSEPLDYSIKDRHYFQEAFFNRKEYISPVFLGRGFGSDPIVAISSPLYAHDKINPIGIIEGSLNINRFIDIDEQNFQNHSQSLVIVDENQRIIYSSSSLGLTPLSQFVFNQSGKLYKTSLSMLNIRDVNNPNPEYIYAKNQLRNGWHVYVLQPFLPLLIIAQNQYLWTFVLLLVSILATSFIARAVSARLTQPLEIIANQFSHFNDTDLTDAVLDDDSPAEVFSLFHRLKASQQALLTHQLQLEEKVAERTFELEQVNTKLQLLAECDSLTGLYNRRYSETRFPAMQDFCERTQEAMTIAILDLDFFKKINDTYGHLAGDESLKVVASLMQQFFKRDTDIVSRYGGEEFLLILPICNALKIEEHLNEFRQTLATTPIINPLDQQCFYITASVGAITANATFSSNLEHWIKQADDNLYQAKDQGRNRVICSLILNTTKSD